MYITQSSKTIGGGRKTKYNEEETYIIDAITVALYLIAPVNVKRVGCRPSNRGEDEKKGCTIAVTCEMFSGQLMAPFMIMDGVPTGYLSRRYNEWDGPATIKFQAKHWMDKPTCKLYLQWQRNCFPNGNIGLIWDFAAAHKSEDVLNYAIQLGITIGFIPAGLTSILQVCDLLINKPLKAAFKKQYCAWKIKNDPGPGKKYKIDRDLIITWMENATNDLNQKLQQDEAVQKAFMKYGQDPRNNNIDVLTEHLASLNENSIYKSLQENQTAFDAYK